MDYSLRLVPFQNCWMMPLTPQDNTEIKNIHRPKRPELYFIYVTPARTRPKTIKQNTALSLK
jgi:hypothetical protein